jgi:hypothetical protein
MKPETMMIDDIKYVRADAVKRDVIEFTGEATVASSMIGKNVLVRSRNEGINAGTVELADDTGVILINCRRIWYHKPLDKNLSWYEGVAQTGLDEKSKVSGTVDRKAIIEDYSMTECTSNAFKSIMELKPNAQN